MDNEKNKEKIPIEELRLAYTEVLEGVSKVNFDKLPSVEVTVATPNYIIALPHDVATRPTEIRAKAFLRHPSAYDSNRVDMVKSEALKKAIESGLPTRKEQVKYLIGEELWSDKEEDQIKTLSNYIVNLNSSLKKMFLKAEQDSIKLKIKKTTKVVEELSDKKEDLLGLTAESFASKKANEYYIYSGLFKDRECKTTFYSEEEFDSLSEQELARIINLYNEVYYKFTAHNIKRMSLMPSFLNGFYLCDDNPFVFFGKPVIKLTFHQVSLFAQGKYFKHLMTNSKNPPPDEIAEKPDELIAWFEQSKEADEAMEKLEAREGKSAESAKEQSGTKSTSLVGASNEDLKKLGIADDGNEGVNLAKEAQKKGGNLNMQDLIKLHGVGKN
jgi:hypothetical protein